MSWIHRLARKLEPYAITNLTLFIVIGQVFVLLTSMLGLIDPAKLYLIPVYAQAGEWWRVVSFMLIPPPYGPVFIAFALYLFYLYGSALEQFWGAFRFNLFIFNGIVLTALAAFLTPFAVGSNMYLLGLVFLAFAWLNPNFELLVFFVLPVKVKWLGLLLWLRYAYEFATGGPATKLAVAAAVANFLLFFGHEIWLSLRRGNRRRIHASQHAADEVEATARHVCSVCGRTDRTNPGLDFRYAADDRCYCSDHLPNRKQPAPTGEASAS